MSSLRSYRCLDFSFVDPDWNHVANKELARIKEITLE